MKKILFGLFSMLVMISCANGVKPLAQEHNYPGEKILVAYVTSRDTLPDPTYITNINYAFGKVADDFETINIENPAFLKEVTALKKSYPHLKVQLSIGGWTAGNFSEMAADDEHRMAFAKNCAKAVKEFDLDGVDIDWEYPTSDEAGISCSPNDTENYTLLMRDIRSQIGKDKLLTQATIFSAKFIDFRAIDEYIDWTNVMTYDMGNPPQYSSPLYRSEHIDSTHWSVEEAINAHLAAGVPPHKMTMGVPFYGRSAEGYNEMLDVTQAHLCPRYQYHWDDVAKACYLTDSTGNVVYCYDNQRTLYYKGLFIREKDLLGGMYWYYGGDNKDGDMRRTLYQVMNGIDPHLGEKIR